MSTKGSEENFAANSSRDNRRMTMVTMTAEQFESLYLQPKSSITTRNPLVGKVGNPTPLGVTVFLLAFMPLTLDLLNFQGTTAASSTVQLGAFYGLSGIGCWLTCIMEWVIGNTFPSVVFGTFGGFWISYGMIVQPSMDLASAFAPASDSGATATAAGAATRAYNSGLAMYFLVWGIIGFLYLIASLKTNLCFFILFLTLVFAFELLSAGYFMAGQGKASEAAELFKVAGGFSFVLCMAALWIDLSLLCAAVDMPFRVPLYDLSGFWMKKSTSTGRDLEA